MKSWVRGGLWGFVVYFAVQIISVGLILPIMLLCYNSWNFRQGDPICALMGLISDNPFNILRNPNPVFIISSIIAFIAIGIIVSIIVGKVKARKQEENK